LHTDWTDYHGFCSIKIHQLNHIESAPVVERPYISDLNLTSIN